MNIGMNKMKSSKALILGIVMIGVSMMFGCGSKSTVNPLGDNLTYSYNKHSKTLTISGQGDMPEDTWEIFRGLSIKHLAIEEGVTSIAKSAFYCHSEITGQIKLPKSVNKIEDFAFYGCSGLTGDLIIPEGVTKISDYAFRGCEGLNGKLVLPSTLTDIGEEAFYKAGFTGELVLPEKLEHIGRAVFYECTEFSGDLIIPDSVTMIGDYAFAYIKGFDGIFKLPEGIDEIAFSAFSGCGNFKGDLVIPKSVTVIGDSAFGYNGFDGRLKLGTDVTDIGDQAFSGCGFIGKVIIPEGVSGIGYATFKDCKNIEEVELNNGLEVISEEAFSGCKALKKIEFPVGVKIIGDNAFTRCGLSGHIVLEDGLYSIGESSFSYCDKIVGITFPESLLNIKDYAFSNCESISGELVIPDNVAYVGEDAFKNCPKVSSVTFGESLAGIGPGAFAGCTGLKSASVKDTTPDYYSQNETNPSFDEQVKLIGFDENPKASELWDSYKETKLTEISKTKGDDSNGAAKEVPYYWTDSLKGETFKGTGAYADTKLAFLNDEVVLSINGREYIKVPFEADQYEEGDEKHIKADNLLYYFGMVSDLVFYDNGYRKNVIKAKMLWDDGSEDIALFTVGSEENVLPFGYEGFENDDCSDESYEEGNDYLDEGEEYEFLGKIDIEDSPEYEPWGEPYNDFYFMKYEDDRHEDSEGNPILWFGDLDKLAVGCSVYCAVENEEINASASSTLKSSGSNNYDAENVCVQNNTQAWVEGSEGSGIGEYIEIKRKLDVCDKDYGVDYTEICIVNGYIKNEKVWKNNNRVKTLAFYYNDEYICDIELEDTYSPQTMSLEEYNIHADSGEEVSFKFEIKDIYKGDKYDDTAITGIIMDFYTPNH